MGDAVYLFRAISPTHKIGVMQSPPDLLAAAKTTVYALNNYTGYCFACSKTPWANNNGFGLSWPPAVRVSEGSNGHVSPGNSVEHLSLSILSLSLDTLSIISYLCPICGLCWASPCLYKSHLTLILDN